MGEEGHEKKSKEGQDIDGNKLHATSPSLILIDRSQRKTYKDGAGVETEGLRKEVTTKNPKV